MRLELVYLHMGHILHLEALRETRRQMKKLEIPFWYPVVRALGRRMIKWGAWLMNTTRSDMDTNSVHIHVISSFSH